MVVFVDVEVVVFVELNHATEIEWSPNLFAL